MKIKSRNSLTRDLANCACAIGHHAVCMHALCPIETRASRRSRACCLSAQLVYSSFGNMWRLCCFWLSCWYDADRCLFCNFLPGLRVHGEAKPILWAEQFLEHPSAKIRSWNLCRSPIRENWIPQKFPAIRYVKTLEYYTLVYVNLHFMPETVLYMITSDLIIRTYMWQKLHKKALFRVRHKFLQVWHQIFKLCS